MTLPTLERASIIEPHRLEASRVAELLGVAPSIGLSAEEIAERRAVAGPNRLAEPPPVPAWKRFLTQFTDRLILVLLGAAVVAFIVSGELKTPMVVLVVVVVNAVIGFVQERRAERSLEALRRMLVSTARVRRDGHLADVPADDVVPGDVVLVEAGDRVPADGRLFVARALEVDESALTGEAQPVAKGTDAVDRDGVAVGDRSGVVHLNTTVTRGRGELVVTATGMATEMGRIAGLLAGTPADRSPLQRQLDRLAQGLVRLAGLIVGAVIVIGLLRGQSLGEVLLTAVALAVAAIPEGLPAVTAVTLAIGVATLAERHAIVKRLASVETLGCTSVICSDKTGTLTLNEMTAVEVVAQLRSRPVTGSGYAPEGAIEARPGDDPAALAELLEAAALCNDAVIRPSEGRWELVGDPTEGALVALAAKGGLDVAELRRRHPRVAEVPFDSATKFMATVDDHRLYAKGAPDVLVGRAATAMGPAGPVPIAAAAAALEDAVEDMGRRGLRVLALAVRDLGPDDWSRADEPAELVGQLTLLGLVGIVDPPRPEVADAIADAHAAGITVTMITGDHAATAAAIGRQLGIDGAVVTGVELDRLDDDELERRLGDVAVFARVAPEHKLRLVTALQHRGEVVAMTGDGVNDAPALKRADIGVAMGITGTEVSKEAATMILADDNFATIVGAVRRGRAIYDNIVSFVRFQLSTTLGFALVFLLAAIVGLADGKPFAAIAILWVNLVMDGPPAMALGVDPASTDVMRRRPRPLGEPILTRRRWLAVATSATVMAAGTLLVLALAPGAEPAAGTATVAGTMGFATFVLFQFFNLLNARSDTRSVFHRDTLRNRWLWLSLATVVALQVMVTHVGVLQRLFDLTSISLAQWASCAAVASSVLWVEETRKAVVRTRTREDHQ